MTSREFFENALGVAIFTAFALVALGALLLLVGAVPLLVALFPISAALLAAVLLIAYLRQRRRRRGRAGYEDEVD
jgi:hypothetical protein